VGAPEAAIVTAADPAHTGTVRVRAEVIAVMPQTLAKPIASTALTGALAVLASYFLGGLDAALLIGALFIPLAWFVQGVLGLSVAAGTVMLTVAVLLLADTLFQLEGTETDIVSQTDAAVRDLRKSEAEADKLRDRLKELGVANEKQGDRLESAGKRVDELVRSSRTARSRLRREQRRSRRLSRALRQARGG